MNAYDSDEVQSTRDVPRLAAGAVSPTGDAVAATGTEAAVSGA